MLVRTLSRRLLFGVVLILVFATHPATSHAFPAPEMGLLHYLAGQGTIHRGGAESAEGNSELVPLCGLCASTVDDHPTAGERPGTENAEQTLPKLTDEQRVKIEPEVWRALRQGQAAVLVHLPEAPPLPDTALPTGKTSRKQALIARLQAHAKTSQADVLAVLTQAQAKGQADKPEAFWVVNTVAATVDLDTTLRLAARPEVAAIRLVRSFEPPGLDDGRRTTDDGWRTATGGQPTAILPWGIQRVGADRVWTTWGLRGEGVTVAVVDTGAQWTHPALRPAYRGRDGRHDYAWFDASGENPDEPVDKVGHGTHVAGIIVGSSDTVQSGVAPGAQWLGVRIFGSNGASDQIVLRAFQWLLAPTDTRGQNPDPSRAPDVVNHSWGHPNGANPTYEAAVRRVREAGIVQIFSAGNDGSLGEATIRTPAAFSVAFAVGSTTPDDRLSGFSAQGPAFSGQTKPDLSAPGSGVLSTFTYDSYDSYDGTSMAAPHVTGAVALLLQANPHLSVADVEQILRLSAVDLGEPGADNLFGAGRLDAYQAVTWARTAGRMGGRVTADAGFSSLIPHPSSLVKGVRQPDGLTFSVTPDAQGVYTVTVPAGTYSLTAEASGFAPSPPATVEVRPDLLTLTDLRLAPVSRTLVTGRVTDLVTGAGAPAVVVATVTSSPKATYSAQADATGAYRLDLPSGEYSLEVKAPRYRVHQATLTVGSTPIDQDVALAGAQSVLLVDADAWAIDNVTPYYRRALTDAGFLHDTLAITDTRAFGAPETRAVVRLPALEELQRYDLIVWAHHYGSPGRLNRETLGSHDAVGLLRGYVEGGGRLLIVGQDIGYLDGFSEFGRPAYAPEFYRDVLKARLEADIAGPTGVYGSPGEIFAGVTARLSAPGGYRRPNVCGANSGLCPDVISARDGATLVLAYSPIDGAGLRTTYTPPSPSQGGEQEGGQTGRVVYLSFNLDGATRSEQAETVRRALTWLSLPGLQVQADRQTALPGDIVRYTATLTSAAATVTPGVALTMTVPSGITVDPASLTEGVTLDPAAGVVRWRGALAPRVTQAVGFAARVKPGEPGGRDLVSVATMSVGHDAADARATVRLEGPDLRQARKLVQPSTLRPGGALTYTIALTNTGSLPAAGARLIDPLPPGTELIPGSLSGGASYDPALRQVYWTGDIPAGSSPPGYTTSDSRQPGGPVYRWVELSAAQGMTPTQVITVWNGQQDDINPPAGPFDLGFDFPFYRQWRRQLYVTDNGWLSFAPTPNILVTELPQLPCQGNPRCEQAPRPLVAPFWFDMTLFQGEIRVWTNRGDMAVVTWQSVRGYDLGGPYTFQAILHADGRIVYQYQQMGSPTNLAVGGVQDDRGARGTQVFYQQTYVTDGLAVQLTPAGALPPPTVRFAVRLPSGSVLARLTNTATLTATLGLSRTLSATAADNPPSLATSTLTLTASGPPPAPGVVYAAPSGVITATLTLRNTGGPGDIAVALPLPNGVTLVPGSLSGGASADPDGRTVRWQGALATGQQHSLVVRLALPDAPLGTRFTYTALLDDGIYETLRLSAVAELQVTDLSRAVKQVSRAEALSGEVVTYTIRLDNAGRAPAGDVQVTDVLPAGLTLIPGSASGGATVDLTANSVTWRGVVPGRGTYSAERVTYQWRDSVGQGTSVTMPDRSDAVSEALPIGFSFPFFGGHYDELRVSPNGWLSFASASRAATGQTLPSPTAPTALLAPFWADLKLDAHSGVFVLREPERLIVTWRRLVGPNGQGEYTFQAILEQDGTVTFQYQTLTGDRTSYAVVGLQDERGVEGLTVAQAPQQRVSPGEAIRLRLPPGPSFAFRARVAAGLLPNTVITNTTTVASFAGVVTPAAVLQVNPVDLVASSYTATRAGDLVQFRLTLRNSGQASVRGVTLALSLPNGVNVEQVAPFGGAALVGRQVTWTGSIPGRDDAGPGDVTVGFDINDPAAGAFLVSEAVIGVPPGVARLAPLTAQIAVPAAPLSASRLTLMPAEAQPGEAMRANLVLINSADQPVTAMVSAPLPASAILVDGSLSASSGPPPILDGSTIRWTGTMPARSTITLGWSARLETLGIVTQSALIQPVNGAPLSLATQARVSRFRLYLPTIVVQQ